MVWRYIKKYIANGVYQRMNDMAKAMHTMLQNGAAAPFLPGYAMRVVKSAAAT